MNTFYIFARSIIFVVFTCIAFPAASVTINLSTGLSSAGVVQTVGGANDANWGVNSQFARIVTPGNPDWWGGWPANDASSSWIVKDPTTNSGNGIGTYVRSFDLTGFDLGTVSAAGHWAVDDEGTLALNGHVIGTYQVHDGWRNFATQTFNITDPSWFNQGSNSLVLTIAQSDNFFEGVRLQGNVTATVPEPGSFPVIAVVFAAYFLQRRKARNRPIVS